MCISSCWKRFMGCLCDYIPQRYLLCGMLFWGMANAYMLRNCLFIAITGMVNHTHAEFPTHPLIIVQKTSDSCPGNESEITEPEYVVRVEWDEMMQGHILSSFYYGYMITHLPGALVAEKFGGKHVLGFGLLLSAILTLLSPVSAQRSPYLFMAVRFLNGLSTGPMFPSLNVILARWVPVFERGRLGALVFSGINTGNIVGNLGGGFLLYHYGWPSIFYLYGLLGLIWFLAFYFTCYSEPGDNPFVSDYEGLLLRLHVNGLLQRKDLPPVPWKKIFTSGPVWSIIFTQFGHDWLLTIMNTALPKYMKQVLKYTPKQYGVATAVPYLAMWISSLCGGCVSDYVANKKLLKLINNRKLMTAMASFGPGIFCLFASYENCNRTMVVIYFSIALAFMGLYFSSAKINILDLCPNYAGIVMALVNGLGTASHIIAPITTGFLITHNTLLEWRKVFWLTSVVICISVLLFLAHGSADLQEWNGTIPRRGSASTSARNSGSSSGRNSLIPQLLLPTPSPLSPSKADVNQLPS